ncbi:hypothetical protein VTN96DRAFT_3364 [Rasamsonia emersonii]
MEENVDGRGNSASKERTAREKGGSSSQECGSWTAGEEIAGEEEKREARGPGGALGLMRPLGRSRPCVGCVVVLATGKDTMLATWQRPSRPWHAASIPKQAWRGGRPDASTRCNFARSLSPPVVALKRQLAADSSFAAGTEDY